MADPPPALPAAISNSMEEEDEKEGDCEELNLTFDDIDQDALMQSLREDNDTKNDTGAAVGGGQVHATSRGNENDVADTVDSPLHQQQKQQQQQQPPPPYILGTLVVRVVAARDLQPVHHHGGIGQLLFGSNNASHNNNNSSSSSSSSNSNTSKHNRGGGGGGAANPYASVRFDRTTQRTSEVVGTVHPIWPRGETMYYDVTHAAWEEEKEPEQPQGVVLADDLVVVGGAPCAPGDPPPKPKVAAPTAHPDEMAQSPPPQPPPNKQPPILTVAIFHAEATGRNSKFPQKGLQKHGESGDSDDIFLGMCSIDVTHVLTGKVNSLDVWLPLSGTLSTSNSSNNSNNSSHNHNASKQRAASVRVVCEYEASDTAPQPLDVVKLTDFCHANDVYPAVPGRAYTVQELDGDEVLIAWTSCEGWVSTFAVHRYMLYCVQRHYSVAEACHDELANLRERIAYSPMVHVVQESVERVPDEGLLAVGTDAIANGVSLLSRWWEQGLETTAQDLTFATNWDGRHNPNTEDSLSTAHPLDDIDSHDEGEESAMQQQQQPSLPWLEHDGALLHESDSAATAGSSRLLEPPRQELLPNMPACPITGEPMRNPVVAADGHTYERTAIARWLTESNKSPLTGSVLSHKDLVPNYMLLSSLQEQAAASVKKAPPAPEIVQEGDEDSVEDVDIAAVEDVDIAASLDEEESATESELVDD